MTENRRIFLNIVATYGRSLYALIIGLFCGRWTLMALGEVDYGLYGLVGGLTVFITFLNGILSISIGRYFAVSVGVDQRMGNHNESNKWFTLALIGESILPLFFVGIGYPCGVLAIQNFLTIPADRVSECIWVWRFVCASCFVGMVTLPFNAMYAAKQYIAELTIYSFVTTSLNAICLYYMITHPGVWLARLSFWGCLLSVLPQVIIASRAYFLFPECRVRFRHLRELSDLRQLLSYSGWTLLGWSGTLFKVQGMAILINKYFGPSVNAAAAIGTNLSGQTDLLSGSLQGAFSPAIMNAYGAGDFEHARGLAYRVCKLGTLLMLVISIPLGLEVQTVLNLWLKNPPEYTAGLCILIMIMTTIDKTAVGHTILVNAKGKIARYQMVLGTSLLLTVPIAWVFLALGFNIYWTGVAMIITMSFTAWGRVWFARKLVQMSARYWFRHILLPLILIVLFTVLVGLIPVRLMSASFLRVVVTTLTCELTLLPFSWIFLLDQIEKEFVASKIRQLKRFGGYYA